MDNENNYKQEMWEKHDLFRFEKIITDNNGIHERTSSNSKPMFIEFIDALNYLNNNSTYHKNEIDFWDVPEKSQGDSCCEDEYCECNMKCVCGHHIRNLYYLQNIEETVTCLVGSECVKKASTDLYNKLVKDKCLICKEVLMDKRKEYQRDGYCSNECYNCCRVCGDWKIKIKGVLE